MSLRVYGIVMHDGQGPPKPPTGGGLRVVALRELAAVVEDGDYTTRVADKTEIDKHFRIVETLFGQDAVLPTPVGTVFRSEEVLQRWMELHYVALSDALAWVEDRVAGRVHITRASPAGAQRELDSDVAAIAAEVSRSLRRRAVASVPLRDDGDAIVVLSAGYLVEAELWHEFADAIADEQERHPALRIALTGPWPPYDFVRMQFGV